MEEVALVLIIAGILLSPLILAIIALVRVGGFERRLRELESKLSGVAPPIAPPTPSPPTPQQPVAAEPASPPSPAPPAMRPGFDLEELIAGRWLNRIGIIALLMATAFFLKYAFDNDWIGEHGRIAIGLLAGASLLVYSQWLLKRGYRYFSEGIAGLGAGILYLSLYAAWSFYQLIPNNVAFVGMILVTASMIGIAVGRDSQRLAILALAGGFLTPALLSTGKDAQVTLFTYLAVLNGGLLLVAWTRQWRVIAISALAATLTYYWAWEKEFYTPEKLFLTISFATLFFAEFAAIPVIQARRSGSLYWEQILLVLVNASSYLITLHEMLYEDYRWALTFAVLALAAVHLVVVQLLPDKKVSTPRLVFAGLALTFVTLAIPIRLEGKWITLAWALEGAVLIWSGFKASARELRWAGLVLYAVVMVRLISIEIPTDTFLLNARFLTFAVAVACFGYSLWVSQSSQLGGAERGLFGLLGIAANTFAVVALSLEVWDLFGRMPTEAALDKDLAQQLGLSLLWTVYASFLILVGVRKASAPLRWQGLALLGLAVGKVFLYDLSSLERVYRIISFVVLGLLLLIVSFYYQRRFADNEKEKT
jgi:uncharacterized membrane protein